MVTSGTCQPMLFCHFESSVTVCRSPCGNESYVSLGAPPFSQQACQQLFMSEIRGSNPIKNSYSGAHRWHHTSAGTPRHSTFRFEGRVFLDASRAPSWKFLCRLHCPTRCYAQCSMNPARGQLYRYLDLETHLILGCVSCAYQYRLQAACTSIVCVNWRIYFIEEWHLLGCYAVWLLKEPTFRRNLALPSSRWQESVNLEQR
jgi:hypothetical protein